MKVVISILLFITILVFVYNFIVNVRQYNLYKIIKRKIILDKNEQNKMNKKSNIKNKLYWLIVKSGIADKSYLWWITPNVVIFISIIVFIVSFTIFIPILKLNLLTLLFCIPISFLPIFILNFLSDLGEERIEKNLINYIIQLKNQSKMNNDIIICFKNTVNYIDKPLSTYIQIFLFEIQQGVNISTAFDNLKVKINFERFKQLINNLENCYFNGGNLYNLLDKTQSVFIKLQNERNKRNEETMSARIVLAILIVISIFIYFKFINSNPTNFDIMINDLVGQVILIFNFISIWVMMFLIIYVKKFDN